MEIPQRINSLHYCVQYGGGKSSEQLQSPLFQSLGWRWKVLRKVTVSILAESRMDVESPHRSKSPLLKSQGLRWKVLREVTVSILAESRMEVESPQRSNSLHYFRV